MIVLDAGVLIGFIDERDRQHAAAFDLLMTTDDYLMHTMTVAEVLVRGERDGRLEELEERLRAIGVVEHPRLPTEAAELARLRSRSGLRLVDCCAVLVAQATGAPLATFDARLAQAAAAQGVDVMDGSAHGGR